MAIRIGNDQGSTDAQRRQGLHRRTLLMASGSTGDTHSLQAKYAQLTWITEASKFIVLENTIMSSTAADIQEDADQSAFNMPGKQSTTLHAVPALTQFELLHQPWQQVTKPCVRHDDAFGPPSRP